LNLLIIGIIISPNSFHQITEEIKEELISIASVILIIVFISLGYLFGIILRMLKVTFLDKLSSLSIRIRRKILFRKTEKWMIEPFPYIKTIGLEIKSKLPSEVYDFYLDTWSKRLVEEGNKRFFNFCKNILTQKDNPIITEVYAIETTLRFLSGMFYGILLSFLGFMSVFTVTKFNVIIFFMCIIYFFSLILIVNNFRKTRIKEVETLFDACFQNKDMFYQLADEDKQ